MGTIPALADTVPGFAAPTAYYGLFIPNGVPAEVISTLEAIWRDRIPNDDAFKAFAADRGTIFAPSFGQEALKVAFPAVQSNAWQLFNSGKAKVSPASVGIPRL